MANEEGPADYPRPDGRGPIEGSMGVLSLTLIWCYPRPDGRGPIEGPYPAPQCQRPAPAYPRPDGRGPIEGVRFWCSCPRPWHYPRPDGRGPIEGVRGCTTSTPRLSYPRPDGRGPIEGGPPRTPPESRHSAIRDLTVAAPLKDARGVPLSLFPQPIRDLTVAAPLKDRRRRCRSERKVRRYPRPDGRGPIEGNLDPTLSTL